jgi:hypothetical protein
MNELMGRLVRRGQEAIQLADRAVFSGDDGDGVITSNRITEHCGTQCDYGSVGCALSMVTINEGGQYNGSRSVVASGSGTARDLGIILTIGSRGHVASWEE